MTDALPKTINEERIYDALKIVSIASSVAAFVYLYGFSISTGVKILSYVSVYDYIRVVLGCFVPVLVPFMIIFFWVNLFAFSTKYESAIIEENECAESINRCSEHRYNVLDKYGEDVDRLFEKCKNILLAALILVLLVILIFRNFQLTLFTFNIVILACWLLFVLFHAKSIKNVMKIFKDINDRNYIFYYKFLSPLIVGIAFVTGCSHGALPWKDKYIFSDFAMVETIDNFKVHGEILFFLDKVVVFREQSHKELIIFPSGRITSIKFPSQNSQ